MIFGDKQLFAIEGEFLEVYGKWTYGRIRFWHCETPFGDFDDTSDIASSSRWGRTFLEHASERSRPDLDGMSSRDLYEFLYGRFIVPIHGTHNKPYPTVEWVRRPYVIEDIGESALRDDYAVLVVRRSDGFDRLIIMDFEKDEVTEGLMPPGYCDRVIDEYCTWAESLRAEAPQKPEAEPGGPSGAT